MFLMSAAARSRRSLDDRSRDLPARSPCRPAAFLGLAALLLVPACRGGAQGCDDPTGICGSGNLVVTVSTSGTDPDPDGYAVVLDGAASGTIGADASRTFRVTATSHTVALDDVAPNCAVQGNPSRTVSVPLDGVATVGFSVACEEIVVPVPTLVVTPPSLSFTTARGGSPESKTVTVRNSGDGTMSWSAADDVAWLSLAPVSGSLGAGQSATVTVSVASAALAAGGYAATITVTAPGATGSPESVAVSLTVNPPGQRALTVTGAGDGSGTVTSDPAGISCTVSAGIAGGDCAASFDEGTDVALTATAAAGSAFVGWSGSCSGAGASPCTVAMSADREVGASFAALPDLSVTPTSLSFSAQEGTSPGPLSVTVRNVGGGTLAWSASDDRSWLSVSPGSGSLAAGESATLTVSVTSNALANGDYAGTVTVTGAGESVPVGVSLRISPVPQQSLTVTGSGAGTGTVASNPAGIACTVTAGSTSGSCAASFDEGTVVGLTPTPAAGSSFGGWSGACTGTGTCQVTLSQARSVEARFDLLPVLEVDPTSLTYAGQEGTDPATQSVTVTNGGGGTLEWAVADDQAWLSAAPTSGSLGAGASATVTVSVASAGLAPGVYTGTVTVTGAGDSQDVAVEYTVTATPTRTLTVTGAGAGAGSVGSDPAGISCAVEAGATSGTCAAEFDEGTSVALTPTPAAGSSFGGWSGACAGTGPCEVTLDAARSVEATFDLLPTLEVDPTSLTFAAQEGTDPASQTVTVTNGGGGTLNWTAAATSGDPAWLGVAPASGSLGAGQSATLTVSVTGTGLAPGDYAGTVTLSGAGDSRDVAVEHTVTEAPTQTLTVTGAGAGAGSVASNPAGIACAVDAGATSGTCAASFDEGTAVTLTATPSAGSAFGGWSGACAGTGPCELTLDAARGVEARFDLLPTLEVDPTSLTFTADEGTDPPSQTLTVTNGGGGTLEWTLTEDAAWLGATPASGSLTAGQSATVTVSVASAALAAGSYADTIAVAGAGDIREVPVDLTVAATPTPPTAGFTSSCIGLTCDFTDTSSDPDGSVAAWSWDFGDGSTSTLQNPQHTYATGGPYTIALVVTDNDGLDSDPSEETVSLSTPVQAGYQLEVRVSPGASLTATQNAAVDEAVARWEEVITGDVSQVTLIRAAGACGGATTPALNETVDDVVIYLDFVFIDGPGGTLGSAGPCSVRFPGFLPALGGMRFDTADLANLEAQGRLGDVILHEMGHVLGYGTIWDALGLLQDPTDVSPAPINDTYFDGPAAIAAFDDVSDPDYTAGPKVPVENDNTAYGTGSLNGHWREAIFGAELMSPSLNAGANPLSLVTIEAMDDIGYTVDPGSADPYSLAFNLVAGRAEEPIVLDLGDDIWRGPIEVIDAAGSSVDVLRF